MGEQLVRGAVFRCANGYFPGFRSGAVGIDSIGAVFGLLHRALGWSPNAKISRLLIHLFLPPCPAPVSCHRGSRTQPSTFFGRTSQVPEYCRSLHGNAKSSLKLLAIKLLSKRSATSIWPDFRHGDCLWSFTENHRQRRWYRLRPQIGLPCCWPTSRKVGIRQFGVCCSRRACRRSRPTADARRST